MLKKSMLFFLLLSTTPLHAENCPSISDIKSGQFRNWQPLDIDNAEPVTGEDLKKFQRKVRGFAFAGWMPDAPEGPAECFYHGFTPDIDYLGVFLVKHTGEPDKNFGNWHSTGFDVMRCDVSIGDCRFK